tara:strand:- start:70 stop:717 length:648 start_codon:yes stop_codon:yes gene_type:complete
MNRTDIINFLANKINAKTYLEIGVRDHKQNFDKITIAHKVGVDPDIEKECDRDPTHKITSDEYFSSHNETFDIIFIDGLHEAEQVERDISNSIDRLNEGGFIVCHDMNPIVFERQLLGQDPLRLEYVKREKEKNNPAYGLWNGDCWKAFVKLKINRDDLIMKTVDTDFGVGVIQKGSQETLDLDLENLTYEGLDRNRKEWLNLISVNNFIEIYKH